MVTPAHIPHCISSKLKALSLSSWLRWEDQEYYNRERKSLHFERFTELPGGGGS